MCIYIYMIIIINNNNNTNNNNTNNNNVIIYILYIYIIYIYIYIFLLYVTIIIITIYIYMYNYISWYVYIMQLRHGSMLSTTVSSCVFRHNENKSHPPCGRDRTVMGQKHGILGGYSHGNPWHSRFFGNLKIPEVCVWEARKSQKSHSHPWIQLRTPGTPSRVEQNAKSAKWQWHKVCHPSCTDHFECDERRWPLECKDHGHSANPPKPRKK